MTPRRFLIGAASVLAVLFAAGLTLAWHPAIAPEPAPVRASFQRSQIERGAELAAIGDCAVCHTRPGGPAYAGGRAIPTPFGRVYSTNITPDEATGIGAWSEPAFRRAMRDGIGRDGRHLYPVLPYPHFTRATDDDIAALYAFAMSRTAVHEAKPSNLLGFPFNQRLLLAGWNLLFLRPGPWQPDPAQDAEWNRGAYLVEGVGHCGACHTPHNALGAERGEDRFAGGAAEGWYAPPLQAANPAPLPWTAAELAAYLRTGYSPQHGAAAGPMTPVTAELARVPEADIVAMATYIASLLPHQTEASLKPQPENGDANATALFAGACGSCHALDAPMTRNGAPPLTANTGLHERTPVSFIQVILHGIPWQEGRAAPYMPGFADTLTDAQIAELATYVRRRFGGQPAAITPDDVARVRSGGGT